MSDDYVKQIEDLRDWYKERLPAFGKVVLSADEYKTGTDSLEGFHGDLVKAAFVEWLSMRKYELSYNQSCVAFFSAAKDLELLEVVNEAATETN
jgi:hypothetical protein